MNKQSAGKSSLGALAIRHEALPMVVKRRRKAEVSNLDGPAESSALGRDEQIRQRAYSLFQARGGEGGNAVEDWLKAEEQINQVGIK